MPGASAPRPADTPLDGLWKGPLKLPGGELEVIFRLVKLSSGEYFATLDVPKQRVSNLSVTVTTLADTITFASVEANCRFTGRLVPDAGQLQGTWQQPGFRVPLTLTHTALPTLATATKTRLTPPYREENVTIPNAAASLQLAGTLTVPAGPGPFPAVALLSDVGAQDRNGTVNEFGPQGWLADYLTRRGIAVLRFDDRGTGQSTGAAEATLVDQVTDAQAALAFLRTRPELIPTQLGLIGHGQGGNVALLAAVRPEPPAFVVGLAPYGLTGREAAMQQEEATLRSLQTSSSQLAIALKRQQMTFDAIRQTINRSQARAIVAKILKQDNPMLSDAAADARASELTTAPYRYFLSFDPAESLAQVACPVLLLYGSADPILNPDSNMVALVNGLSISRLVTTKKLPGVNHVFQPERDQWPIVAGQAQPNFSPAAEEAIRAWITALPAK
ncbi:alpha/beta hydrolase [Hymenobacter ginsengisoli]|uniref:Alpha/beta hydrolase n=1 Tax=Hymenobacter ginsengisoli TaxID=1051626 RepID=A0ABP8QDR2_9BACT|nr:MULTISPECIES: alpha/beta fold hydrolase [unclassified Hymenobacter]MBO2031561.1 alpha/beta fold hydrolase [Hymenobacter sp. BT559]